MDSAASNLVVSEDRKTLSFDFAGRSWRINYDGAATYHANHSTQKIARLADCIPLSAKTIFDVGANCGLFAGMARLRCPAADIHAFEPSPTLLKFVHANTDGRANVHEVAVGEIDGPIDLFINSFSQQTNSLIQSAVVPFSKGDSIEREQVDCITLDRFCADRGIDRIDVLKVDVQGAEGAVFRGARAMLANVQMLLIESSWLELDSVAGVLPFAQEYGFRHLAVINPVHLGADLLLTRDVPTVPEKSLTTFDLRRDIRAWF